MDSKLRQALKTLYSQPFIFEFVPANFILLICDGEGRVLWVDPESEDNVLNPIRRTLPGKNLRDYFRVTPPDDLAESAGLDDFVRYYAFDETAVRRKKRYPTLRVFGSRNLLEKELVETHFITTVSYSQIRFIRIQPDHFLGIIFFNFEDLLFRATDSRLFLVDHENRIIGLNRSALEKLPLGSDPLNRPLSDFLKCDLEPPPGPFPAGLRKGTLLAAWPGKLPPETRFTENAQTEKGAIVLDAKNRYAALRLPPILECGRRDFTMEAAFDPLEGEFPFIILNGDLSDGPFPDDTNGITLVPLPPDHWDKIGGPHLFVKVRGEIHRCFRLPRSEKNQDGLYTLALTGRNGHLFVQWCGRTVGTMSLDLIMAEYFRAIPFSEVQPVVVGIRRGGLARIRKLSITRHGLSAPSQVLVPSTAFFLSDPGTRYGVRSRYRPPRGRLPVKRELHLTDLSLAEEVALLSRAKEESDHEVERLKRELSARIGTDRLTGDSPPMRDLKNKISALARTDAPVLITGETGTGKSLIAEIIHAQSARAGRPFVKVDCAALPATLIETELFGHEKGAFTGAVAQRTGKFELAHTGTVFLDEIGELPPALQAKLLSVLEDRVVTRVGGTTPIPLDIRIVAATNRDLEKAQADGSFRTDLYFRLAALRIHVPPLREHPQDLALLSRGILDTVPGRPGLALSPAALERIGRHSWPGNVRELQNVIREAAALTRGQELGPRDLRLPESAAGPAPGPLPGVRRPRYKHTSAETIRETLSRCHNNIAWAAEHLGISRMTIYKKLKNS